MWQKAADHGLIKGLITDIVPQGVVNLQYADDTIIFLDQDVQKAKNMKWVLTCFELMSGMRINFHKSEMIPLNLDKPQTNDMTTIFGCPVGTFPINYLGIPFHYQNLSRVDLQPMVEKILKRIAGWRGKLLSYVGRIVLIKTCLSSIPIYLISFFKFPKWALDSINSHMACCLWNDF